MADVEKLVTFFDYTIKGEKYSYAVDYDCLDTALFFCNQFVEDYPETADMTDEEYETFLAEHFDGLIAKYYAYLYEFFSEDAEDEYMEEKKATI